MDTNLITVVSRMKICLGTARRRARSIILELTYKLSRLWETMKKHLSGIKVHVALKDCSKKRRKADYLQMKIVRANGTVIKFYKGTLMQAIFDNEQIALSVQPKTAAGNNAVVDGVVSWESSDPTVATVVVDGADSFKASVVATGKLGTTQIKVSADADMGAGVTTITGLLDLEIIPGAAASFAITVGDRKPVTPVVPAPAPVTP